MRYAKELSHWTAKRRSARGLVLLLSLCQVLIACAGTVPTAPAPEAGRTDMPPEERVRVRTAPDGFASLVVAGNLVPPQVAQPCAPSTCPFAGQTVTVLVTPVGGPQGPLSGPLHELQAEFEVATGARLEIVERAQDEHFASLITHLTAGDDRYDVSIAGAWWLGDLVAQDLILPYDQFYDDPRFPRWEIDDVQPAPRSLLEYAGRRYMVAHDHDGQVLYYRRDLLEDPAHQAAFQARYGYPLGAPTTWEQFRDVAAYFDGQDLNGDGRPDDGLTMHLRAGLQGMFHFISFAAPYVIGPENPNTFWFDPETMQPLLDSPGHVRALEAMVDLVQFGPEQMLEWDLGQSWDHFLAGQAALTFTWGDLGALAQQDGSAVKGRIGAAPLPGATAYYNLRAGRWTPTAAPNQVGNTTGGSWAGVISKSSDVPEAAYYLLALMANRKKSLIYAARGWDGVDPGRFSHYLPPHGSARIDDYLAARWDRRDIGSYSAAYYHTFNNPLQAPYLRIPGTFSYLTTLDIHLYEAARGQLSPAEALHATVLDFEELTDRLGRAQQIAIYRASLGLP